ncbi:MAG: MBL fold metallo-hydrolase, partial [Gammaproteobacteria bacterium]|nr:MBL fold metallo-hydrolase [Gammaproteobacteria bacterium]
MSKIPALIGLLLLYLTGASLQAAKAPAIDTEYTADKIAEDVYVIHGPLETPNPINQGFMNNPGIIITDAGVVVVDPGGSVQSGEMVISHIEKLTDKPVVAVFDSHVHGDHWLGNQAFMEKYPEVKIYAHHEMIKAVKL